MVLKLRSKILRNLNSSEVLRHYRARSRCSRSIRTLLRRGDAQAFSEEALGLVDRDANYSADQYGNNRAAMEENLPSSILDLGRDLEKATPVTFATVVKAHSLPYIKIATASEIATNIRPDHLWVMNLRSAYAHFLVENGGDIEKAWDLLCMYEETAQNLDWREWGSLYRDLEPSLNHLVKIAKRAWPSISRKVSADETYLWADAICSALYNRDAYEEEIDEDETVV